MNFDRRTLLMTTGTLTVLPISGCLSSPSEKLEDTEIEKDGNTITLIQNVSSNANDILLSLKYRSTVTGETGVVNSFQGDELTKSSDQYQKNISKETIFGEIPEGEPVELFTEAQLKEYTTQSDAVETDSYIGGSYHMLKYEAESMNYIDTDQAINSQNEHDDAFDINKIHVLESDNTIRYKIVFFIHEPHLKNFEEVSYKQPNRFGVIPFYFDLEVPKKEKEVLQEVAESKQITWQEFHKEVSTEIGTVTYYKTDLVKDFANQITTQIKQYKTSTFTSVADIKLLLRLYDNLIEYDYGTIREDSSKHLKYFSQILYDKASICQGTSFSIASILHNLGYDVGLQAVLETDWEYPQAFHMEPTVNPENDELEYFRDEYPRKYGNPDRILSGLPNKKIENQAVVYPGHSIGENRRERLDRDKARRRTVKRVQMKYLEA